ncbi:MAG: hypothetical protein LQ337_006921 [Flavoplaca oasis]|nr:MAG: hypothetical protein LQ337_006921 [Flavoplaca oasis]
MAADLRSIQQQDTEPGNPRVTPHKVTFFSLPFELRMQVYGYNKPRRIHIAPPDEVQESFNKRTKPWGLVLSSPQARAEVRTLFYPSTPIEIYFECYNSALAYQTWIDGLHEGLEASLRHLVIDQFVDINWIPDGPVRQRPTERRKRLRREHISRIRDKAATFQDVLECPSNDDSDAETTVVTETEGNWQIRWLNYPLEGDSNEIEAMEEKLQQILDRSERSSTAISGLGENAVRDLAASFAASGLEYWTDGQYEEQYDEDFVEEDDGEYYEDPGEGHDGHDGLDEAGQSEEVTIETPFEKAATLG